MRLIWNGLGAFGIALLLYYSWTDKIPWWVKEGFSKLVDRGSEITQSLPKEDWSKPPEVETKKEEEGEKKAGDKATETNKEDKEKSLFSGEINIGGLRSRYNLGIKQSEESEAVGRKDMGAEK